jgi:hypothetical protein
MLLEYGPTRNILRQFSTRVRHPCGRRRFALTIEQTRSLSSYAMHSKFSNALETLSDSHISHSVKLPRNHGNQTDINLEKKTSNVKQNRCPKLSGPLVDLTAEPVHSVVEVVAELPVEVAVAVATEMVGPNPETTAWEEAPASAPKLVHAVVEHLKPGNSFS